MKFINTLRYSLLALIFVTHAASAAIINIAGTANINESMGHAVAAGNFDCDAYDDLAIGSDGEINIIYGGTGSGNKLGTPGNFQFTLASLGAVTPFEEKVALAAGDFDGNGCDDLAVGVYDASVGSVDRTGEVYVLYGNGNGLNAGAPQVFNQNVTSIADVAERGDGFGYALAVGDFNGDNHDDLAIGVPYELPGGAVHVLHGQPWAGLGAVTSRFYTQNTSGIADTSESQDYFGAALATGDFDNNGYDDLAIGVPGETTITYTDQAGAVHVLYSTSSSLSTAGSQFWQQGVGGLLGTQSARENFGHSLASGNFDNWEGDDLAIGVPNEGYNTVSGSHVGGVHVLYGEQNVGLESQWNQFFRADDAGIPVYNTGSRFGWSLAVGNFNNDDFDDLAIGARDNFFTNIGDGGALYVLYGAGIFSTSSSEYLHQNITGADGDAESYDYFGEALATGDFDGNGSSDLVAGVSGEDYNGVSSAGVAQVFYGQGASGLIAPILGVNDVIFVQ